MNTRSKTKATMSSRSVAPHISPPHSPPPSSSSLAEKEPAVSSGQCQAADDDGASSMRSAQTNSSASSTVKARRATAEAAYKRRQYETMKALAEAQQQATLVRQLAEVEEAEYRAELEQINAEAELEGSRRSKQSATSQKRTQKWVKSISFIRGNITDEVSQPAQLTGTQAAAPSLAAHLNVQAGFFPQAPGCAGTVPQPSVAGLEGQDLNPPVFCNNLPPLILQAMADTAAAAKSLASTQKPKIELFTYTGNASQWLQFKKLFNTTKHSFTPAENVARLQSALRGPAREAVASLLISAEDPDDIMRALERSFACPEMIVFGEVQVLKQLPRLSADLKELGVISNRVRNSLATMKFLNHQEYLHSPEIFHVILGKLNPLLKLRWSDYASDISSSSLSKLEILSDFLIREHERYTKFAFSPESAVPVAPLKRENIHSVSHDKGKNNEKTECVYCKKSHNVKTCDELKALSVDERWRWLRENKVCYKCLKRNPHQWKSCKVNPCGVNGCSYRHHPLLHGRQGLLLVTSPAPETRSCNNAVCAVASESVAPSTSSSTGTPHVSPEGRVTVSNIGIQREHSETNTFLKLVPVIVSGPAGDFETFALLDDGSTATLIDSNVAAHIGLSGPRDLIAVSGVGGLQKKANISYVDFHIQGKYEVNKYLIKRARAMPSLSLSTQTLSKQTVDSYKHLQDLTNFLVHTDATPTVLIGAEHWHLSITHEARTGRNNEPVACHTLLGWTLYGVASSKTKPVEFINHCQLDYAELSEHERLEHLIKEQYKLDSLGISKRETLHSKQDLRAIEILEKTITRLPTGRYQVGLPWRDNINCVPDSYPQALSRFLSLERRMLREPEFADAYKQFIKNMLDKGYAEECDPDTYYSNSTYTGKLANLTSLSTDSTMPKIRWYLPHFGVYHPQKRKLRVVHDAAAANQGVSLNTLLLQGPDLLENLLGILFRFREGRVAISADIKEMFPQIRIREQDRDALRFLWRDFQSKEAPIKEYRMTAVIFGASSSPFTALYVKNKNAMFYQDLYPEAANASVHSSYMDDYLDSVDDVNKAAQLSSDIVTIHRNACFEMRDWISNNPEALRLLPDELCAVQPTTEVELCDDSTAVNKVLGISWNPVTDTIGFRTGLEGYKFKEGYLNKRKVLSHLMKIYDPLGLLGPIVVRGRILLQEAWRSNIDWDTPFPPSVALRWYDWFKELSEISSLRIPRCYANVNGDLLLHRELHVFADASELAYACVAYWRFVYPNETIKLALIASKARVAPLKPTSIPRLELQAALIASRLAKTIKEFHKEKPIRTFLWTDSKTVLGWLRSDARTFKPFVAHRIGEITENSRVQDWRWVPTDLNVADDATRVIHLNSTYHRWFAGPPFLLNDPKDWPVEPAGQPMVQEERKRSSELVVAHLLITADFSRFSDWLRLLRATARVLQAAAKFRSFLDRPKLTVSNTAMRDRHRAIILTSTTLLPLSAEFIEAAERHILKRSQSETFSVEIHSITQDVPLPKSSSLWKLSPVMGEDGLLRLDGRIRAVENISADVKRPILLDGRHHVVRLLIQYFHRRAGHANNETVINELRQKYWILRMRSTVRSVTHQCLFCRIKKAKPITPKTGDLPAQRLAHHRRPFTYTGVDYFGPITTSIGRRKEKRYVALFTCMTSRAVHLELVHSLTADSAIMSLRRFIARRGTPDTIYSDNGTCFVGANRILREFYHPEVENFAANRGVKWSFIPAAAPFFGGCWERLVRSVKVALNATLHEKAPKEEVLITLLLEAEAIVNSRPLSHVSVCHEDQETLTPFHFLLGSSSNQILPSALNDRDLLGRSDWRKALRLADHFWHRWIREILPTMQPRQIGDTRQQALKTGDIVLLVDENLPRGTWPRGRVAATFPGKDGIVRVVDVATSGGLLRRPTKKLVKLST